MPKLTQEQKEIIRGVVDTYVAEYLGSSWQEILGICTDTPEEFDWAYEHLYTSVSFEPPTQEG